MINKYTIVIIFNNNTIYQVTKIHKQLNDILSKVRDDEAALEPEALACHYRQNILGAEINK